MYNTTVTTSVCVTCGQPGHARSNSSLCPRNPKRRRTLSPEPDLPEPDLPERRTLDLKQ
ncbi:hypothetical protein BGZ65_009888, partial [Modicella reniformis]